MQQYYDLEISILSCLLQKPKLMEELKLEDKHFIKYKKIWQFMKSFYKKFENFDLTLMFSVCKNKYHLMTYIEFIVKSEPRMSLFNDYQDRLIELFNQNQKEKWIINKIYELSNDLYVNLINLEEFNLKLSEIYKSANEIFKKM